MAVIDVSSTNQDLDETLPFEKGKSDQLFEYIQKHIVDDNHCVSMKTLTDIFGLNGSDRRNRHYVKQIIELKFPQKLIFLTIQNEPQVVTRGDAKDTGDIVHQSNKFKCYRWLPIFFASRLISLLITKKKNLSCGHPHTNPSWNVVINIPRA